MSEKENGECKENESFQSFPFARKNSIDARKSVACQWLIRTIFADLLNRMAKEFHTYTLPNGLRCIHKRTNRDVSHLGLIVNAGSRDELENEEGLAHFIEHSIFKGTKKRKTFHILSRLDSVGGEINAYTTKEETWVYASFLKAHFERALELVGDICLNSVFPEKEIQKEKDVIIDEINSYLDTPGEIIFDDFEELVFNGHPLGRNILGTVDSVKSLKRQDIFNMFERRYRMDQMVFSSVGNQTLAEVKELANKYLGHIKTQPSEDKRQLFTGYKPVSKEEKRDGYQIHYILGNQAYGSGDKQKTALILLNNYLGGPAMNSRLNLMIREKHGFTYNIESNYTAYQETGVLQIYLGTDEKFFGRSKKLVQKELKTLRDKKLGPTQLHNAKQQLIGQIALGQESGVGNMLALGKSYLLYDKVAPLADVIKSIDSLKSSQLLEVANEIFDPKTLSELTYLN